MKDILLPKFESNSRKGEKGKVLIVGGSAKYYGAPIFSSLAAEAVGADLITLCSNADVLNAIKNYSLNIFCHKFMHQDLSLKDIGYIVSLSKKNDAMLVGNGCATDKDTLRAIRTIVQESHCPIVIDGDGLQEKTLLAIKQDTALLTPHKGEYERMFGHAATPEKVQEMAALHNCVILVKGEVDIVACKDDIYLNHTGCPQMRVGGTGDALAGIATAFIAMGLTHYDAAVSAVHYYGCLGQELSKTHFALNTKMLIDNISVFLRTTSA